MYHSYDYPCIGVRRHECVARGRSAEVGLTSTLWSPFQAIWTKLEATETMSLSSSLNLPMRSMCGSVDTWSESKSRMYNVHTHACLSACRWRPCPKIISSLGSWQRLPHRPLLERDSLYCSCMQQHKFLHCIVHARLVGLDHNWKRVVRSYIHIYQASLHPISH